MATLDKYHAISTAYDDDDNAAEYDAYEYNHQIVDDSGDIVVLCGSEEMRDHLLKLLLANLLPE